jgi:hypothetical protein
MEISFFENRNQRTVGEVLDQEVIVKLLRLEFIDFSVDLGFLVQVGEDVSEGFEA